MIMNRIKIREPLTHKENYGIFNEVIDTGYMELHTDDVNPVTYNYYFNWLVNCMTDGIEHPVWHGSSKIHVIFSDNVDCTLTINDLLLNLIMWYMAVKTNTPITSEWLVWDSHITQKTITSYVNKNFLDKKRKIYTNRYLNNVIADCTDMFSIFDRISKYLSDSISFYDDILLMERCPDYYDYLHLDISNQPIDKTRSMIDKATDGAVHTIQNSKQYLGYYHSLASNFLTGEALNKKQFSETYIAIGTKPDPDGNVIPYIISNSFINGGVQNDTARYIESLAGRKASVLAHLNVSITGTFARKLNENNKSSFLHKDPNYVCHTANPIRLTITNFDILMRLNLRYYSEVPNGVVHRIGFNDVGLIGKTIYLYSPMTCASNANGHGVCYRCYGDLAYVNRDINIGSIAATLLSSVFTQRMLSAKHLLETVIAIIKWCEQFDEYFKVDTDQIVFDPDKDPDGYKIIISIDNIEEDESNSEEDDDDEDKISYFDSSSSESNFYITEFILVTPEGEKIPINSEDFNRMCLSKEMYHIINKHMDNVSEDNTITIDLNSVDVNNMFTIMFDNSELSKSLDIVNKIIDKVSVASTMDKDSFLQSFLEALNNANVKLNSVHGEILLSNQIRRSKNDILNRPAWEYENAEHVVISLRQALSSNPSLVTSLVYQDISNQLNTSPLTCDKSAPSILDLNMLKHPQPYIQAVNIVKKKYDDDYNMSALGVDKEVNDQRPIDPFVFK